MSVVDEIEKLNQLKLSGAITEEEFAKAKSDLLNPRTVSQQIGETFSKVSVNDNQWAMFIHLSQFCGYIVPGAGWIVPIVLWQVKKENEMLDRHGKEVVNWILTQLILGICFFFLTFVFIGVPLLIALALVGVIFPIVGGIKANSGQLWEYPCNIRLIT